MRHSIIIIAVLIVGAVNAFRFSYFSVNTVHSMLPLLVIGLLAVSLYWKNSKEHAIYMTSFLALFIVVLFGHVLWDLDEIAVEVAIGYVVRVYIVFTVTMVCLAGATWYGYNRYIIKGSR